MKYIKSKKSGTVRYVNDISAEKAIRSGKWYLINKIDNQCIDTLITLLKEYSELFNKNADDMKDCPSCKEDVIIRWSVSITLSIIAECLEEVKYEC